MINYMMLSLPLNYLKKQKVWDSNRNFPFSYFHDSLVRFDPYFCSKLFPSPSLTPRFNPFFPSISAIPGRKGKIPNARYNPLRSWLDVTMTGVAQKFLVASLLMWTVPVAILYAFNNNLFPGVHSLSPHSLTLLSGFIAVISVNMVIGFYIYMAMKEPSDKCEPDPSFMAQAKASLQKPLDEAENSNAQQREKEE
ncbi:hypothetical protein MLD38_031353 [Melastoma candidum]|uniref:Uncharacterized protein n=1 Tax=Melastoma candidum TaxID=119954 RepID=A0ACB9MPF2_9MYRT|nr:hypothetical protein MLD38_031353 [Melastoma candidum]